MTRKPARALLEVQIEVDGLPLRVRSSDTLAVALLRSGRLAIRLSRSAEPRGLYCAIGVCNECLVTVDGVQNVRACTTPVTAGLRVESQGLATIPSAPA